MLVSRILTVAVLALQAGAIPTPSDDQGLSKFPSWATPTAASSSTAKAAVQLQQLNHIALRNARENLVQKQLHNQNGECTPQNWHVRRDWRDFSRLERKNWIDSVLCLQRQRPMTPYKKAPGVRTRYDDFVATHINQTMFIHYSVCWMLLKHEGIGYRAAVADLQPGNVFGLAPLVYIRIRAILA